jgi:pyruvate dehydrogenase E2 component (dihydrolipoamide acetyltransferase)
MATEVIMPKLGETMEEGTVVLWLKKEGEGVRKGEGLLEIMTEKATYEIESPQDGLLLSILVGENEVRPVGHILGVIGKRGEDISDLLSKAERIKISPAARRLAEEEEVDISRIKGSGPEGRIVRDDVLKAAKEKKKPPYKGKLVTLTSIKKLTAERMSESFKTVPHFSVNINVEMRSVLDLIKEIAPEVERKFTAPLSVTAVLIRGVSRALKDHPLLNSKFVDGKIELIEDVNISVAVATEEGLVAPVIHKADEMSLGEISSTLKELTNRAREGRLSLEDVSGGTFTISNLGMFGIDSFTPIINPPQAAILAVGAVKERPLVRSGKVVATPMVSLTLVADHRVLDGVLVAEFLKRLKEILEKAQLL